VVGRLKNKVSKIQTHHVQNVVCKAKNEMQIYKLIGKLKKGIEIISSFIEGWCKKKLVFAHRASALRDSLGSPRTLHTFANRTS
jgi:hypothetical protein